MVGDVFILCLSPFMPSVNSYVIHVDCDASSVNEVLEYSIHYSLEGGWGVG